MTSPGSDNYGSNALNQYTALPLLSPPAVPSYDADGNATAYPVPTAPSANASLTWDGENRLVSVVAGTPALTTTYFYDALSRRIAKTTGGNTTAYVYDGWNLIAEYTGETLTRTYTWGMDLSGSMQGAGGIGGLLAVGIPTGQSNPGSYYPTYDGNGNVSEYLDSSGTVQAHYEYDPFGNTPVSNETMAASFLHRFSTKPLDGETGLYYYGYRYYDPGTGRWPSRDPIGERGGKNLYAFVGNRAPNRVDILGRSPYADPHVGRAMSGRPAAQECPRRIKVVAISADWLNEPSEPISRRREWVKATRSEQDFRILPNNIRSNNQLIDEIETLMEEERAKTDCCDVCIRELHVSGHGAGGGILWNRRLGTLEKAPPIFNAFQLKEENLAEELKQYLCDDGIVKLQGCGTATYIENRHECQSLADLLDRSVGAETEEELPAGPDRNQNDNFWVHPKR